MLLITLKGRPICGGNRLVKYTTRRGNTYDAKDFERKLLVRFGPLKYTDHNETLSHIRQKRTLRKHQQEFEWLANLVQDWPEKTLIGAFMGGLKPELAAVCRFINLDPMLNQSTSRRSR